jgi:hypothetical protein
MIRLFVIDIIEYFYGTADPILKIISHILIK